MVSTLEQDAPAATLTGVTPEFSERPSEASAFAREPVEPETEWLSSRDQAWLRSYIAHVVREADRLRGRVQRMLREIPRLREFRRTVQQLLACPGIQKAHWRRIVVERLRAAPTPMAYVEALLDLCLLKRGGDGLDVGIDVLSQTGDLALNYARAFRIQDAPRWAKGPEIGHHPHDDIWYILLRAASRSCASEEDRLQLLTSCVEAGNRGIREAVVEGLSDLNTLRAQQLLRTLAHQDPDAFIRRIAQEALDDVAEN